MSLLKTNVANMIHKLLLKEESIGYLNISKLSKVNSGKQKTQKQNQKNRKFRKT